MRSGEALSSQREGVPGNAAAGHLDLAFGDAGIVITDVVSLQDERAFALALQGDGKIVVAGRADTGSSGFDFALVRYNRDGSLDSTFGLASGWVTTFFTLEFDAAFAVAIQADGKIVAAGTAGGVRGEHFALCRYHSNGSLDLSFGGGPVITALPVGSDARAHFVAILPDGKILAAGSAGSGSSVLVRYESDGSLDLTFGDGGFVTNDFGADVGVASAAALQPDGKIIVVGWNSVDLVVVRYEANGSLDSTFGSGGFVTTDFDSSTDRALAVALQADGKIVAAGDTFSPSKGSQWAMARYDADGSLDAGFGVGGLVRQNKSAFTATAVAIQGDGKIIVAGEAGTGSLAFALARYNVDGSLVTTFGAGGLVTTDISGFDLLNGIAIQDDGNIVAVGGADLDGFVVARYLHGDCASSSPPSPVQIPQASDGSPTALVGNRTISFTAGDPGRVQAIRIRAETLPSPFNVWEGDYFATEPQDVCGASGVVDPAACPAGFPVLAIAGLTCDPLSAHFADWSTLPKIYVQGPVVVPSGEYAVQVVDQSCAPESELTYSAPIAVVNSGFGDIAGGFEPDGSVWTGPDGLVNIADDVLSAIDAFGNRPGNPTKLRSDIEPCILDFKINIIDIVYLLDAFRGLPFPFEPGLRGCPSDPCGE